SAVTGVWSNQIGFSWQGMPPDLQPLFGTIAVTHDYGQTVGWQFLQGRDFSRDFSTDTSSMVLNESAAKFIGFKNPVGEIIKKDNKEYKVIGVIRDMVMQSPYEPIQPTIFFLNYGWANQIFVRLSPQLSASEGLARVEKVFQKHNPASPFDYKFVDQEYAAKFSAEERVGKLASVFAGLAIFISCLGLFVLPHGPLAGQLPVPGGVFLGDFCRRRAGGGAGHAAHGELPGHPGGQPGPHPVAEDGVGTKLVSHTLRVLETLRVWRR
ncbi:MAG: ABC transporter permease, partial [Bernardetiaceae bacterium]|nr:ABC transporter permease [Bernardetiaceae bacterium]